MASLKIGAAYIRVSTDAQGEDDRYSIPEQRGAIREYARSKAIHIPTDLEYVDQHTGTEIDRPGLNRLRDAIRTGKINCVIIHTASRLSRSTRDALILRDEFVAAGVEIHSVESGKFDATNNSSILLYDIKAAIADNERRTIVERMRSAKTRKAASVWVGTSRAPIGYKRAYPTDSSKRSAVLVIDEAGRRIVQQIFRAYTGPLMPSLSAIAASLNRRGVKSPEGRKWNPTTIRRILRNPIYIGRLRYRDIMADMPALAMIDRAVFAAAAHRLKRNKELSARAKYRTVLLSGYLFCSCGSRNTVKQTGPYRYYTCSAKSKWPYVSTKDRCKMPMVKMRDLDDAVWQYVLDTISDEGIERGLAYRATLQAAEPDSTATDLKRVEGEIDKLSRRAAVVMAQFDDADDRTMALVNDQIKAMGLEIGKLEKRREELLAVQEAVEIARRSAVNLGDQIRAVRKGMERAGLEKRRRLMEAIELRVALIEWDIQARRLRYRVTCGVGEPREFEISKNRHP